MNQRPTKNWILHEEAPSDFLRSVPEHPLLLQVLHNRGVRTPADATAFLNGSDAIADNPFRLKDMDTAVSRILQALERQETICVYGDFDADGVCATALLVSALQAAGGQVGAYIPDRVDEGYGLNRDAVAQIAKKASLMVTVDCGIRSVDEVAYARALGMDAIVTDHHSIGPDFPPALAVINPQRKDCPSQFKRLAGAGVAYRLAQAVLRAATQHAWCRLREDEVIEWEEGLLDLVALGTVADMMPLLADNRWLVARGLAKLNTTERPGLQALLAQADVRPGKIDAAAISFRLAPRINAAGRLAHARIAYQLLRTTKPAEAYTITAELEGLNQKRRSLTDAAQSVAEAQVAEQMTEDPSLLIVQSPNIVSGVVGLVAGKLVERYYRPVVVIEEGPEESRGSARSIAEFDISQALDEVQHLLVRHGGHGRAAGFTVATERLPEFAAELRAVAERELCDLGDLRPSLAVDADVKLDTLNWALQQQFARLEPTGQDNPTPRLLARRARVREARTVGDGKHLRMIVDAGPGTPVIDAVGFGFGDWAAILRGEQLVDIVFQLEANEWQGRQRLQLNVQDLRLAS